MVGLVIVFPELVLVYKKDASTVDPNSIEMTIPTEGGGESGGAPPADSGGLQNYGSPPADQGYGTGAPPADSAPADASKSMEDAFKVPPPEPEKK